MTDLPTRELGRTGLQVTTLGYGAMELRGGSRGREVTPADAGAVLNAVLDAGINFIDTSIDYGMSEELIGEHISHRRSEFYLATKCGCPVNQPPPKPGERWQHIFTRENIVAGVEQSLARMRTDYIDVLQFHAGPSQEVLEEHGAVETLRELQREGKVRFIGMSSTLPNLADHIEMGVFDAFQIPYSSLQRQHEAVITEAAEAGAGTIIRGGAARGAPSEGRQSGNAWELWERAGLDDLLGEMSRMEFVMRFTLSHPDLHTTIVGTVNLDHLRDNVEALLAGPLPEEVYAETKRRLAAAAAESE